MSNELHWGGINVKSLCKAIFPDIWMAFAVMVIAYLGLGIVENMRYTPSYTSSTVVAVYPLNRMYTPEDSAGALETVSSVNEVFNSDMFITGLKERLAEPDDFSITSEQISGTFILMLSATSSSSENASQTLRTALDYYEEISSHLVGDNHLEILTEPDFPSSVSANDSRILKYRPLLALFLGVGMAGFLALMYVMRRTYKTVSAIRDNYKNVRFFSVKASTSGKQSRRNKRKPGKVPNKEAMRKTAIELLQMLRVKNAKSIYVTSAASGDSKAEIVVSLAGQLAGSGKSVIILETDPDNYEIQESIDCVKEYEDLTDQSIKVIFADKDNEQDDFLDLAKESENKHGLEAAEKIADVVLVDGRVWSGSRDELIWKEASDTSLAVCRQDNADFYAIDRMMTDLQGNNPDFLGCVLYGF